LIAFREIGQALPNQLIRSTSAAAERGREVVE
jgi:hypothetical protein